MRVIAGTLGGRNFDSPNSHRTHPMSDKMRGALFNSLGDITGLTVMDAFAGTGALSFEAVSRGAASALAVENDKAAFLTIASNIKSLGVEDRVELFMGNVGTWSNNHASQKFDLVLADPPYDKLNDGLIHRLIRNSQGVFVLSWPGKEYLPKMPGLVLVSKKTYGDAQLAFYKTTGK